MRTVKELREAIKNIPDDFEIWIEYPERYGFHSPFEMDTCFDGETDCIKAINCGRDEHKRRFYILHHF